MATGRFLFNHRGQNWVVARDHFSVDVSREWLILLLYKDIIDKKRLDLNNQNS